MPLKGAIINHLPVSWEKIPIFILPPEIIESFRRKEREDEDIHVSDLIGCQYRRVKEKLLDYYLPVEALYRMARGKAWDSLAQAYQREGGIYQPRLSTKIDGTLLWGTPDVIDTKRGTIEDFKRPRRKMKEVPLAYEEQLNAYAFLVKTNETFPVIKGLYLVVLGPTVHQRIKIPLWSYEQSNTLLATRLSTLLSLLGEKTISTCNDPFCYYCNNETIFLGE